MDESPILVINTGSSSLKLGLYERAGDEERLVMDGVADAIGARQGSLTLRGGDGQVLRAEDQAFATHADALAIAVQWMHEAGAEKPVAVGHRVVHGGPKLVEHQRITPEVLQELKDAVHFAPLHIPLALALIEAAEKAYPELPQFACFDTAFHRTLPEVASRFPLSRALFDRGIRRYGFHGLSYESVVERMRESLPEKMVIAHLGNGASLAAVRRGESVDTSMGLTPLGGVPMATRSGDLDPGVLLYLLRTGHTDADGLEQMLNHHAGMKAVSGGDSDMRVLEKRAAAQDADAELAIEIFCTAVRKTVAAYAAVLGGLDLLVFTGGIGEHSARVRAGVCRGLEFLGVALDGEKNGRSECEIMDGSERVRVLVMTAEEDRQIARHCRRLLAM